MAQRRIFISYNHKDQMKAKGFNLLRWNKNVDFECVGRHLLDPVNSENEKYIQEKVTEQINGSSVTGVLVGKETHDSEWVKDEIERSLAKECPNGILAIQLEDDASLPPGSPVGDALRDAGAEIIDWEPHKFQEAIERAFEAARRGRQIRNTGSVSTSCAR